jgi:hypothetical protein
MSDLDSISIKINYRHDIAKKNIVDYIFKNVPSHIYKIYGAKNSANGRIFF